MNTLVQLKQGSFRQGTVAYLQKIDRCIFVRWSIGVKETVRKGEEQGQVVVWRFRGEWVNILG